MYGNASHPTIIKQTTKLSQSRARKEAQSEQSLAKRGRRILPMRSRDHIPPGGSASAVCAATQSSTQDPRAAKGEAKTTTILEDILFLCFPSCSPRLQIITIIAIYSRTLLPEAGTTADPTTSRAVQFTALVWFLRSRSTSRGSDRIFSLFLVLAEFSDRSHEQHSASGLPVRAQDPL